MKTIYKSDPSKGLTKQNAFYFEFELKSKNTVVVDSLYNLLTRDLFEQRRGTLKGL